MGRFRAAAVVLVLTLGCALMAGPADAAGEDGPLLINQDVLVDTTTGQSNIGPLGHVDAALHQLVLEPTTLTVTGGHELRFVGGNAAVILATGDVVVDGRISVAANASNPGPAGGRGAPPWTGAGGQGGAGSAGGGGGGYSGTTGSASGLPGQSLGGNGGTGGAPGCGGHGGRVTGAPVTQSGQTGSPDCPLGTTPPGAGGGGGGGGGYLVGLDAATGQFVGGSGGGGGAAPPTTTTPTSGGGAGGNGGGALRIVSPTTITITGTLVADGTSGGNGQLAGAAGGGGGGGGTLLLDASQVLAPGTLSAKGGRFSGQPSGSPSAAGAGGLGGDGLIRIQTTCGQLSGTVGTIDPNPVFGTSTTVPVVARDDTVNVVEDTPLTVSAPGVLGNDCGAGLTAAITTGPAHGSASLAADGSLSYTPQPNYHGPDSLGYTATDSGGHTARATVTVTVSPVNDPPVAAEDTYQVTAGDTLVADAGQGVLANDNDLDGDPLTAQLETVPAHGTVNLAADGSFTYQPAGAYSGPDAFTYRAFDGSLTSAPATVQIKIALAGGTLAARVQQPINPDGSSTFTIKRGVVPVKFTLTADGTPTCALLPGTLELTRLGGANPGPVDEAVFTGAADAGSNFRISDCQYVYNLAVKQLGAGTYRVDILISGQQIGSATFDLK
jgi:hypothetical protein